MLKTIKGSMLTGEMNVFAALAGQRHDGLLALAERNGPVSGFTSGHQAPAHDHHL
jgi:hypothetical protein